MAVKDEIEQIKTKYRK